MRKLMLSIFLVSLCAASTFGKTSEIYHKIEFYGGYTTEGEQVKIKSPAFDDSTVGIYARNNADFLDLYFLEFLLYAMNL